MWKLCNTSKFPVPCLPAGFASPKLREGIVANPYPNFFIANSIQNS
jgi:hypothetical protein